MVCSSQTATELLLWTLSGFFCCRFTSSNLQSLNSSLRVHCRLKAASASNAATPSAKTPLYNFSSNKLPSPAPSLAWLKRNRPLFSSLCQSHSSRPPSAPQPANITHAHPMNTFTVPTRQRTKSFFMIQKKSTMMLRLQRHTHPSFAHGGPTFLHPSRTGIQRP